MTQAPERPARAKSAWIALILWACAEPDVPAAAPEAPSPSPVADVAPVGLAAASPRPLDDSSTFAFGAMPLYTPPLADGEGRELVDGHCSVCHATTYIGMQPPLPREKWQAVVDKMVNVHGATIPDEARPRIADYLAAHYGP